MSYSTNNLRPWSAEIGDDLITQSMIDSHKDESGNFLDSIYDNLKGSEFHFYVEQEEKYGFPPHIIIVPYDYFSFNCGWWWEQNIGSFIKKLGIDLSLDERYPCYFISKLGLDEVKKQLLYYGLVENKDLRL